MFKYNPRQSMVWNSKKNRIQEGGEAIAITFAFTSFLCGILSILSLGYKKR